MWEEALGLSLEAENEEVTLMSRASRAPLDFSELSKKKMGLGADLFIDHRGVGNTYC